MAEIELKTIETVSNQPFRKLVTTIGELPSAFIESMSYYEMLAWFVNWLETTVIPTVNNNAEAVEELQGLFVQLKTFVDNYFDNLDVQEEINNKLDAMVEDGTLQEIITTYIQSNVAWTFDTVADMKLATNLVDGSYARTLGFYSINDGGGALYKITDTGTANEMDVIAVGSLYANLVPENNTIYTAQFGILGDGTTDESVKLKAFFAYDTANYIVNSANILIDDNMLISSNSKIVFNDGTKITRKATSSNAYQMLKIINKTNVEIINAHLIGDKETHIGTSGESGHGIVVSYSQNVTLRDCFVEYTWGDGYYLGESFDTPKELDPLNYVLINCKASHCSRNGFSLTGGSNHKLINCSADHIDRTAPKCGLDIEPEGPDWQTISGLHNCEIINFNSSYNDVAGIQIAVMYGPADNIVIDGHVSSHEYEGVLYSQYNYESRDIATSHVVYKNASISSCNHGVHIYNTDTSVDCSLLVQNVEVNGCNIASDGRGIWFQSQNNANSGNVTLDNISVKNEIGLYDFQYLMVMPTASQNYTISNIVVKNTSRANAPDATHYTIACDLPNGEVKYVNCDFQCDIEKETSSSGYLSLTSLNNIYGINCTKNTTVALNANGLNPEGEYSIKFFNDANSPTVTHTIDFGTTNSVYYGNTLLNSRWLNTASRSASIKFYKQGSSICILELTGYTIS